MTNFPDENALDNRKPPAETELLGMLERGEVLLPPIELRLHHPALIEDSRKGGEWADGYLDVRWGNRSATYVFEYKSASTPRMQEIAMAHVRRVSTRLPFFPLIIVPYLSDEALRILDREATSGIDLCGNGLLIAEDFRFWRSGQPNRYKDTRPIRNPFQGDSSIFARCFLLRDSFSSLLELGQFAQERAFDAYPAFKSKTLTQGTASKVVQTLVDELAVRKTGKSLTVLDKRRLLKLLRQGYRRADRTKVIGSSPLGLEKVWEMLREERTHGSLRAVATGLSSAGYYKALSGGNRLSLYVSDLNAATTVLQVRAGKAFADIELIEDRKNTTYFDARQEGDRLWASPVQTWLELMDQGPREQEAAQEIERMLLANQAGKE